MMPIAPIAPLTQRPEHEIEYIMDDTDCQGKKTLMNNRTPATSPMSLVLGLAISSGHVMNSTTSLTPPLLVQAPSSADHEQEVNLEHTVR